MTEAVVEPQCTRGTWTQGVLAKLRLNLQAQHDKAGDAQPGMKSMTWE